MRASRTVFRTLLVAALAATPSSTAAQARIPDEFTNLRFLSEDIQKRELIGIMRGFTIQLGVGRCGFCHTVSDGLDQPDDDFASDEKATKRKARAMLQMVQDINQNHIAQLPARGEPNIEVTCVTCHAGRNRPTTLEQEVSWALADGGIEAMRARYAELRERYFGMGAYNFGTRTLEGIARSLQSDNPDAAMAVTEMNLEHYPESAQSWLTKGILHQAAGENEAAIAAFERSLELAPVNPVATERLEQLKGRNNFQ
ncbi:MAG: c-type cytochrome [Gemmatimonadetes bacterium]|nr:c-type cytochrome [Gemmatimonadota bacterium]